MADLWFVATFCPRNATCSDGADALTPSNGPKIQTITFNEPKDMAIISTARQYKEEMSFYKDNTRPEDWAKCEGQMLPINGGI